MLRSIIWIVSLALAACGGVADPIVEKPGMTVEEMNRDLADCNKQQLAAGITFGKFRARCMEGKGYKVLFSNS